MRLNMGYYSLPNGRLGRGLLRAAQLTVTGLMVILPLHGQRGPGPFPGTYINRGDPNYDWVRDRYSQASDWLLASAGDPLSQVSWGFALDDDGGPGQCIRRLWVWLDRQAKVHVRLRQPLLPLADALQRLHERHPDEDIGALCARLPMVDVDLTGDRLQDLNVAEIAPELAILAPPDPASIYDNPCDGWWEWRVVSKLPLIVYERNGFLKAMGQRIAARWTKTFEEDGGPPRGMSYDQDRNWVMAWTSGLASRCRVIFIQDQAQVGYRRLLNRQSVEDLGSELLCYALGHGEDARLTQVLLAGGVDPNRLDLKGNRPLNLIEGKMDLCQTLLKAGADPTGIDLYRRSALMEAAGYCSPEVVELLLEKGCPVTLRDHWGHTALDWVLIRGLCDDPSWKKRGKAIIASLLAHGVPLNNRDWEGESTLGQARKRGFADIIDLLVKAGARDE